MKIYIVRRLLQMIPTILVISFLIFSLLYITPGDPVNLVLGVGETQMVKPQVYERVRDELGLNDPFFVRYGKFIVNAFKGDLGRSYVTRTSVFKQIVKHLPATLILTVASMFVALLISVPLGTLAALKHNSIWDNIATFFATLGVSLPKFWFSLVLILFFSLRLGWLPSTGIGYIEDGLGNYLKHLILPAVSLGMGMAATQTRMIRSSLLDVLNQDYIRFCRSKGVKERVVIFGHAIRNALIPVVTVIGSEFGGLLGGAVVTETIFSWPGVGRLVVNSISKRDYPMIQGVTLVICLFYLLINLIVDISYAYLNPKIQLK